MNLSFPCAVPEIPVRDLKQAADYYEHHLEFRIDCGGDGAGTADISMGNCRLFLADDSVRERYGNAGPVFVWLNLDSKERVDEQHGLWRVSQAKIVSPPESKPCGLQEFTVANLDANLFKVFYDFGTPERYRKY